MKVGLLVWVDKTIEETQMFGIRYMPVWAYTLASYIRDIPEVEIFLYDTRIFDTQKTPHADIFLVSGINQDVDTLKSNLLALKLKYPNSKIVLGGPIVSSYQLVNKLELLNEFDHLFLGDGERMIKEVIISLRDSKPLAKLITDTQKFTLDRARAIDYKLLKENKSHYYGGVLEVSRGCPFLCEFCDIRTKPGNNTSNNKSIEVILEELSFYGELGIKNILMACDNFIGNHAWAELLCDHIIELKEKKNYDFNIYTWLTINLVHFPQLMQKMKRAGFEMFFIGVESFGENQLLETAKVQNTNLDIIKAVRTIQSYGFIVVAGLIFGFDTDPDDVVDSALKGIHDAGIISGDPSLLTALPGTPLFKRMKSSGRLRENKFGLGGKKYVTNIRYLKPKHKMIEGFISFVHQFNSPDYQLRRYKNFLSALVPQASVKRSSYIDVFQFWSLLKNNPKAIMLSVKRVWAIINSPYKIWVVFNAYRATKSNPSGKMSYFYFWIFNWSNSILKYGNLSSDDFDIESVDLDFRIENIVPADYLSDMFEPIGANKIQAQRRTTLGSLKKWIEEKTNENR